MDLIHPQKTIEIIQKYNFTFRKNFGQNFLIDSHVLDKIIAASELTPEDVVLEIGPGIGTMTQQLSRHAGKVIAVEIDRDLIPILEETLADCKNVQLINADIMKLDLKELIAREAGGRPVKVTANLPYYITTPIIMELFESGAPIDLVTVMVQKEVAERMQAGPGTKDYGALSLAVQYYASPYIAAYVPQNCFIPRPTVGSAVITLKRYKEPPVAVQDPKQMFRLIRAAFGQRRKTLGNCISHAEDLNYTKAQTEEALKAMGLPAGIRGEALTLEQFARLSDLLQNGADGDGTPDGEEKGSQRNG